MFQIDVPTVLRTSKQAQAQLNKLAPAIIPAVEMAAANYILNQLITKEIPQWKKVTRISVYGKHFKTDLQRRYYFWAKAHGLIDVPYRRRGKHGGISTQWHIIGGHDGEHLYLRNDDPAAIYVYDDRLQNRLIGRIGWKTIGVVITEKAKNLGPVVLRAANAAIKKVVPKP